MELKAERYCSPENYSGASSTLEYVHATFGMAGIIRQLPLHKKKRGKAFRFNCFLNLPGFQIKKV
jgi:hypothetical protein